MYENVVERCLLNKKTVQLTLHSEYTFRIPMAFDPKTCYFKFEFLNLEAKEFNFNIFLKLSNSNNVVVKKINIRKKTAFFSLNNELPFSGYYLLLGVACDENIHLSISIIEIDKYKLQ